MSHQNTLDISHFAKTRYSAKAYDSSKKISAEDVEKIKELLRLSPSSINLQPWYFVIASSDDAKERIAKSTDRFFAFNRDSIVKSSHVVVFARRLLADEAYLSTLLEQEDRDGRYADPSQKAQMQGGRSMFVNLHRDEYKDLEAWMDKQVYLNAGQFLLGVAALGIDATPMEGVEASVIDDAFGLREKGYTSSLVVTLGYADLDKDYNAKLPKSRLPYADILEEV